MSGELSCVTGDHKSSIRVGRKTLIRWHAGDLHTLSTGHQVNDGCNVFIVVVVIVWGDTEPQTSQYVLGLRSGTGWQHDRAGGCVTGKLTCLAQISTKIIHCTEDSRGHVWYRVRAFWTRVGAIRCNYPVRKHRKVRISFLFTEWGSIRSPDLDKVCNTIMREILKLQTKNWVYLRPEDLFYGSIISQIKLWVRTKIIKKNFYDTGWWESKPVFVLCWVLYLSYHSYLHFYCQQPSASDISYISFCQNMDFLPSSQDFWVFGWNHQLRGVETVTFWKT